MLSSFDAYSVPVWRGEKEMNKNLTKAEKDLVSGSWSN